MYIKCKTILLKFDHIFLLKVSDRSCFVIQSVVAFFNVWIRPEASAHYYQALISSIEYGMMKEFEMILYHEQIFN